MNFPQNVKQAFAPLGARLYLYESEMYIHDFADFHAPEGIIDRMDVEYEDIMFKIGGVINGFDDSLIIEEAERYRERVMKIINELKPRTFEYKIDKADIQKVTVSKKRSLQLIQGWKAELYFYLIHLESIRSVRTKKVDSTIAEEISSEQSNYIIREIKLDEKFSTKTLSDYKPHFTTQQAALFFYYLRDKNIIPHYDNAPLSLLAKFLFNLDNSNLRKALARINHTELNSEDLKMLKKTFELLLSQIDTDLQNN